MSVTICTLMSCYNAITRITNGMLHDVIIDPCTDICSFVQVLPIGSIGILTNNLSEYIPGMGSYMAIGAPISMINRDIISMINRLASFCYTIALIVPRTFKHVPMQQNLNIHYHLQYSMNIRSTSKRFMCFCIWQYSPYVREMIMMPCSHADFTFKTCASEADFVLINKGINCGKIVSVKDITNKAWYKIHSNIDIDELTNNINSLRINFKELPGTFLSKRELIYMYSQYY